MLNLILRTLLALSFVFTASAYGQNEIFYNDLKIGREQESDISIEANIGRTNNPLFRYNATLSEWEFSDDGVTFISLSDLLVDISGKADIDSPSFTGTPTAPTPLTGDDSNKIATTEYVQDAIANFGAGDVTGPESSTDSAVALFDGATGKVLKNSSVTVESNGSITTGSLWLGSTSQILSSTGTLSLGSSGVITRTLGQFNAYGVVTSNITTDSSSTGSDAVISTPTTKVLRLSNPSLDSVSEIGVGLNSQELVLINSTGKELFLNTDGNISSDDGRAVKLNNGSITSLMYDNLASKWVVGTGSGSGGISKWISGTSYFVDDVVIYSGSIYQSIENNSDTVFNPLKWELLSFDSEISNETESFKVQNIEARRVVKTSDTSALIEPNQDNLLLNGSFEAQNATEGWTVTSLATATASTSNVLEGKKKVCLSGVGSIYQLLDDTDKFHGRKFISRVNVQNPSGREAQACLYDGEDLHKCIDIVPSTEFREYVIQDNTFIEGKTYGVIITSSELNGICVDQTSVELDKNEAFVANIEGDWQSSISSSAGNVVTSDWASSVTEQKGNSAIYSLGQGSLTALRAGFVDMTVSTSTTSSAELRVNILKNGVLVAYQMERDGGINNHQISASARLAVEKGDIVSVTTASGTPSSYVVTILATARSQVINYPDETFSTDINPLEWSTSVTDSSPVGTISTGYYTSANALVNSPTAPNQATSLMRSQGILVNLRGAGVGGSTAVPNRLYLKLPKNMGGVQITAYKDATRVVTGDISYSTTGSSNQNRSGLQHSYDPDTGILWIDAGAVLASSATSSVTSWSDGTVTVAPTIPLYLVISATKNGGALVNKSPRTLVKVVEDGNNWAHIYSDGWVEQRVVSASFPSPLSSGFTTIPTDLLIPQKDTSYSVTPSLQDGNNCPVSTGKDSTSSTTSVVIGIRSFCGTTAPVVTASIVVKGYGAASYLLENFGIKANY